MMKITAPESRIDKKAIRAWRITGILFLLPFLIAAGVVYYLVDAIQQVPFMGIYLLLGFTLFILMILLLPGLRWKRWRYQINEEDIDLQRGIIITKRTLVPINRIQHVDNRQGPIYKMFGLSSVTVSTAATTHEIPALNDEIAEQVRHNISKFVNKAREDV
jgi:hypothetical protein